MNFQLEFSAPTSFIKPCKLLARKTLNSEAFCGVRARSLLSGLFDERPPIAFCIAAFLDWLGPRSREGLRL